MQDEILECLAISTQFAAHATYAGTPRQAIADGYSAVDAAFSAVLISSGVKPSKVHKAKFDQVKSNFPKLLDGYTEPLKGGARSVGGVEWQEVESFYREWLQARYEKFDVSPSRALTRVAEANRVLDFAIRQVASAQGLPNDGVKALVDARAFGSSECPLYEALSGAHDHLFDEAEQLGEDVGNRLGVKMAAVTNFSSLDLVASDDLTREIIKSDDKIAHDCAKLHVQLCRMMERLRHKRREALEQDKGMARPESTNDATNFMFALRFKYHGEKLSETGERLTQSFAGLFPKAKK